MTFRSICPSYTPLSPREARKILDISETEYRIALEGGLLHKSLQYESRFSNETNMHTLADLVVFEITRHFGWPNQEADRLTIEVEQVVDDLCEFHEELSKFEICNTDQYCDLFTKNFHPELSKLRKIDIAPINWIGIDAITKLSISIWLNIFCRTISIITSNHSRQNLHIVPLSKSLYFVNQSSNSYKMESIIAANKNSPCSRVANTKCDIQASDDSFWSLSRSKTGENNPFQGLPMQLIGGGNQAERPSSALLLWSTGNVPQISQSSFLTMKLSI